MEKMTEIGELREDVDRKFDEILRRLDRIEERFELRIDREIERLREEAKEDRALREKLSEDVKALQMQRWIVGGAAVAGGGGIGGLIQMLTGG